MNNYPITAQQWARFLANAGPYIVELLVCGVLNGAADDVQLSGGRKDVDIRGTVAARAFRIEVKSGWWDVEGSFETLAFASLGDTQVADLVAIVGKVAGSEVTLGPDAIGADDRLLYLVPMPLLRAKLTFQGAGRSIVSTADVAPYSVDLAGGLTRERLLALLDESANLPAVVSGGA